MIIGKKIHLRPIIQDDLIHLNKWKNDENIYKYLGGGFMPTSITQQSKWLESLIDTTGNNKRFIICNSDSHPIGMIGLYSINWIHRSCEIGLFLGEKSEQGKGYAQEACTLLENFAKNYVNLRKIKLNVVKHNEKASNFWLRLNYKEVGILKEERFIDGEYRDLIIMEKFL